LAPTSIHRRAHPLGANDLADHHPAHRVVGGPGDAVAECGKRQMPHLKPPAIGENRDNHCRYQHRQTDKNLRPPPLDALDISTDERAEDHHRRHAQQRHERHLKCRACALVDKDADHQHLEPSYREDDEADQP